MSRSSHARARYAQLALVGGYAAVVALFVAGLLRLEPYDDSYFFKRFAVHFLHHGVMAWNVGDGPVYGNTSQLFQFVAAAVAAVTRPHYVFLMRLVLAAALVAGFACALTLSSRYRDASGGAAALLFCSPILLFTAVSGMETALVFGALVAFLLLLEAELPARGGWLLAPAAMVAIYLLRPDALALTGIAWAAHRLLVRRRVPWREGIALAVGMAATLAALKLYYGTALPTSFYLKSSHFSIYGTYFRALSARSEHKHLIYFGMVAAPFVYVAAYRPSRWSATLLVAAGLFTAYHAAETIDVMGMHSRFFAPALVFVAAAAMPAVPALARRRWWIWLAHAAFLGAYAAALVLLYRHRMVPNNKEWVIAKVAPQLYVGWVASAALLLVGATLGRARLATAAILVATAVGVLRAHPIRTLRAPRDADYLAAELHHTTTWRGIRRLKRCLGDHISVYHSEIGLLGAMMPDAHITDLAGLMDPDIVLHHPPFDAYCLRDRPEAIFLPHRNYRALNRKIRASRCIRDYTRVVRRGSSPLYIRNDLLPAYRSCRRARPR